MKVCVVDYLRDKRMDIMEGNATYFSTPNYQYGYVLSLFEGGIKI